LLPLAHIENDFSIHATILGFYRVVSGDDQIQIASKKAKALLDNSVAEYLMREDIFLLVDAAVRKKGEDLDQESSLFLQSMYDNYFRAGAGILDGSQKQHLKVIEECLGLLKIQYQENLGLYTSSIHFTSSELEGVLERILSQLERNGDDDKFQVVLSNSEHSAIVSYTEKTETRKHLYLACQNRCSQKSPILKEAIILRH
jgi:metallopeptidase MepB